MPIKLTKPTQFYRNIIDLMFFSFVLFVCITDFLPFINPVTVLCADPIDAHGFINLSFYENGIAVMTNTDIDYYDYTSNELDQQFSELDLAGYSKIEITHSTPNFIVVNSKDIYSTRSQPFLKLMSCDECLINDVYEHNQRLVTILQTPGGEYQPKQLMSTSDSFKDYFFSDTHTYTNLGHSFDEANAVILTNDYTGKATVSSIFMYDSKGELSGAFEFIDKTYYQAYICEEILMFIGINEVVCYNNEGELLISERVPNALDCEIAYINGSFIYYHDLNIDETANAFIISPDGELSKTHMLFNQNNMLSFDKVLISSDNDNLRFFAKDGKLLHTEVFSEKIVSIQQNPFLDRMFYVTTEDDKIYPIQIFDNRKFSISNFKLR